MKCKSCPRYRICPGIIEEDVKEFDMENFRELFFNDIQMTDCVLSFV